MFYSVRSCATLAKTRSLPDKFDRTWARRNNDVNPLEQAIVYVEAYDWRWNTFKFTIPIAVILAVMAPSLVWVTAELASLQPVLEEKGLSPYMQMATQLTAMILSIGCTVTIAYVAANWKALPSKEEAEKFIADLNAFLEWSGLGEQELELFELSATKRSEIAAQIMTQHALDMLLHESQYCGDKLDSGFLNEVAALTKEMEKKFRTLRVLGLLEDVKWGYKKKYFGLARKQIDAEAKKSAGKDKAA